MKHENIIIHPDAKALIFDIDGTLADTMPVHYACWVEVLGSKGIDYRKDIFYKLAGMPTAAIIPEINRIYNTDLDVEEIVQKKEKAYINNIKKIRPIEPSVKLLKGYHGKLPVSAGTGSYRHIAELTLNAIGMDRYINILVTADDVERHKPYPETFLKCAELMGIQPRCCQVLEDTEIGFKAVKNAGMILTDINKYL
jgi:beta-phosphoglucomutase-like phosphatase (HAD superfamily)